jgi:hypothetical protein
MIYVVVVALLHVLGNDLGRAIKYPLKIIVFAIELDLDDDDDLLATIGDLDVDPVVFVLFTILVAFALQNLANLDVIEEQLREEAFQDDEIGLAFEESFHGPIESYEFAFGHIVSPCGADCA